MGFEPTKELPPCRFSRPVLSTAQPPFHNLAFTKYTLFIAQNFSQRQLNYRFKLIFYSSPLIYIGSYCMSSSPIRRCRPSTLIALKDILFRVSSLGIRLIIFILIVVLVSISKNFYINFLAAFYKNTSDLLL